MSEVIVGKSLSENMPLWRYMSIDKLINLLSSEKLFLTPLSFYKKTDPFEGLLPKVAFKAVMEITMKGLDKYESQIKSIEKNYLKLIERKNITQSQLQLSEFKKIKEDALLSRATWINISKKILTSTCVQCWYQSDTESEAMWKLYSDSGKGIAIKTSVGSLTKALNTRLPEVSLRLGKVKYLDFLCDTLEPKDCVVDGITSPLLKRNEYAHENEVRLYSIPKVAYNEWDEYKPQPIIVDVDISTMIEELYISPYVGEPFGSSVMKICEIFGIPKQKIIESKLLENYANLLDEFLPSRIE